MQRRLWSGLERTMTKGTSAAGCLLVAGYSNKTSEIPSAARCSKRVALQFDHVYQLCWLSDCLRLARLDVPTSVDALVALLAPESPTLAPGCERCLHTPQALSTSWPVSRLPPNLAGSDYSQSTRFSWHWVFDQS